MNTLFQKALGKEQNGCFEEALQLFHESLLKEEPVDEGDLHFHCGWCLENNVHKDLALWFYRKATELTNSPAVKANSFFRAGWLLLHTKEFRQAAEMFWNAAQCIEESNVLQEVYPHALYWHAVCLESEGRYLDALKWYRVVQSLSPQLDPESRFRQIVCLNQIGCYSDALRVCLSFDDPAPGEFTEDRYQELRLLAQREGKILKACLSEQLGKETPLC